MFRCLFVYKWNIIIYISALKIVSAFLFLVFHFGSIIFFFPVLETVLQRLQHIPNNVCEIRPMFLDKFVEVTKLIPYCFDKLISNIIFITIVKKKKMHKF